MIGTGYVGLVAGTCLADFGMNVTCVDIDEQKIDRLNRGEAPIYEIGLSDLIRRNAKLGRLHFTTDLKEAMDQALVIFLAVGTPEGEDGRPDLSQILRVAEQVGATMTEYKVIAIKSTVPVGSSRIIRETIKASQKTKEKPIDFDVVSNPEFLREGAAINDFLRPDRIILGSDSERALAIMRDVYRPLYLLKKPILATSNETAELIKYAANSMLALRISYMNEIANLCDRVGADVYDVAIALGMDKRIGPKFLHSGPGFGGSCFPKDVKGLAGIARDNDYEFKTVEALIEVNARQRTITIDKAREALGGFESKTITLLGLSFKPDTDDVREAPAIHIGRALLDAGAVVKAYDPAAMTEAVRLLPRLKCTEDPYTACEGSDLVMIITEWNEFRDLDLARVKDKVRTPILFDTRNIYDPERVRALGFTYLSTGRPVA
jgi:UDPglucose 6-dehydrogenase